MVAACVAAATAAAMITADGAAAAGGTQHVLLLSVDGMHQADLTWYVAHHPQSALAGLVGRGSQFTAAATPFPDSWASSPAATRGRRRSSTTSSTTMR